MTEPRSAPALVETAAAVIVAALSIYLLIVGETILIPFVLAVFITYLLVALSHALQRLKVGRRHLTPGSALAAAIVLLFLGIALLVQLIAGNVRDVVDAAPAYQVRLEDLLAQLNTVAAATFNGGKPISVTALLQQIDLSAITTKLAGVFQAFAANTFEIVIYVAFLLLELNVFDRKLNAMFAGEARRAAVRATLREIGHKIERYVLIKTLVSFITGCVSLLVLTILGVDFAPFWALLHFVLNFVPYVGPMAAITLPTVFALLQFGTFTKALLAAGFLIGNQLLVNNALEPRLAGRTLNLSPITIMIGLSVWGTMWGVTGMVLSVPIMVMAMIVLSQFQRTRPIAVLMSERGEIR